MPEFHWSVHPGNRNTPSRMLKRSSSKAAASEAARRTLLYVAPLSDARTPLVGFFSILLDDDSTKVRKDEPVSCDDLTGLNRHRIAEHGASIGEGVKLATFSARIGTCGQIRQQRVIELASHKRCGNLFWVHAGDTCPEASRNHLACKQRRGQAPDRKERRHTGSRKLRFPIPAHLIQEEIAERHYAHTSGKRSLYRRFH